MKPELPDKVLEELNNIQKIPGVKNLAIYKTSVACEENMKIEAGLGDKESVQEEEYTSVDVLDLEVKNIKHLNGKYEILYETEGVD